MNNNLSLTVSCKLYVFNSIKITDSIESFVQEVDYTSFFLIRKKMVHTINLLRNQTALLGLYIFDSLQWLIRLLRKWTILLKMYVFNLLKKSHKINLFGNQTTLAALGNSIKMLN